MAASSARHRRSRLGWGVLLSCLAIEVLLLAWVTLVTLRAAIDAAAATTATAAAQNYSLIAMAVICLGWVVITLIGSMRSWASWVRGSAVTMHVLLFAAGTGCLQLAIGPWWLGFALIALALLGFGAAILALPQLTSADPAAAEPGAAEPGAPGAASNDSDAE